ncbi:iron export ABC transporter permease subunit FetB [Kamptonema sp. UHCC 0994]|uniref:ABC transporter permease n=1 Tax=Kamptonema sp. UHCC 0994 TaxID=3031329 RepID=UPI0023B9F7E0|nr:iron export ABC transporter permease subunit FetB [Kamptonema sp. UHCC 0994]MDF0553904.1 iron export ABC transporter permease subunit FetB [Kamptonema sp. UHCC 0994]
MIKISYNFPVKQLTIVALIALDFTDLALAFGMVAIAIALSAWQNLGLEWQLAIAATRTAIQLILVGYVLAVVFDPNNKNPWLVLVVLVVMLTIASIVASNRISKKIPKLLPLVWGSIFLGAALTLSYTNFIVIQPQTWYEPQYLIPLAGIVLGNAMNGAAIAGERLVSTVNASQLEIETHLSLGATPQQAIAQYRKDAVKTGLMPTLNTMMVIGVVTLPGTITGQLLGGIQPLDAAAYQILIMFMVALANITTALLVTQGLCRQFFNREAQMKRY